MVLATVAMSSVYPSLAACATYSVAILLPAPGRFSTTTDCPSDSESFLASTRATMSAEDAGPKPTIMRTGRDG